jgi:hypothetical protein
MYAARHFYPNWMGETTTNRTDQLLVATNYATKCTKRGREEEEQFRASL